MNSNLRDEFPSTLKDTTPSKNDVRRKIDRAYLDLLENLDNWRRTEIRMLDANYPADYKGITTSDFHEYYMGGRWFADPDRVKPEISDATREFIAKRAAKA